VPAWRDWKPADIVRLEGITRARITRVMGELRLALEIPLQILSMPDLARRPAITWRALRPITRICDLGWDEGAGAPPVSIHAPTRGSITTAQPGSRCVTTHSSSGPSF
jgi:hypothetical protein